MSIDKRMNDTILRCLALLSKCYHITFIERNALRNQLNHNIVEQYIQHRYISHRTLLYNVSPLH